MTQPGGQPLGSFGDFQLLAELGRDGPFVCYRALQRQLDRLVVLVRLAPDARAVPERAAELRREAEATARVEHPGVVRVLETGEVDGVPYLVRAHIAGETLAERVGRGPMPERLAAEWARQLAETLFFVHGKGEQHLNLRPEDVHLGRDSRVRLSGFGTADRVAGLPGVRAPEQTGPAGEAANARTDIYHIGAILYFSLAGHLPLSRGAGRARGRRRPDAGPAPPRQRGRRVSRDLEAICLKCLRRRPSERYAGAKELIADLRRFLSYQPVQARAGGWRRPLLWCRRQVRPLAVAAAVALGLALPAAWDRYRAAAAWKVLLTPGADPAAYAAALHRLDRLAEHRPHDEELRAGRTLALLRQGDPEQAVQLSQLRCKDLGWSRTQRQVRALAELSLGQFEDAQSRQPPPGSAQLADPLAREYQEALGDGDVIARAVDRGEQAALEHAATIQPTPELVRVLVLRLLDYSNKGFPTLARTALDRIEPGWAGHEGARRAAPDLIAQLPAATLDVRQAAVKTLDRVDPAWPRRAEARRVIPELVVRLADPPDASDGRGPADVLVTLARIDPQWQRSDEARTAAPALVHQLAERARKQSMKPVALAPAPIPAPMPRWRRWNPPGVVDRPAPPPRPDKPKAPEDPAAAGWAVVDTLARLGGTAADVAPDLCALLEGSNQTLRCQALAALTAVEPRWGQTDAGRQAFADLLNLLGDGRGDGAALALRTLARMPLPDRSGAVSKLVLALPGEDALEFLGKLDRNWRRSPGARRAVSELVKRFHAGEPVQRVEAAWVLAQLGDAAAVPELIAALTDNRDVAPVKEPVQAWLGKQQRATVNEAARRALEEIDPRWVRSGEAKKAQGDLVRWLAGIDSLDPVPGELEVVKALESIRPDWRRSAEVREAVTGLVKALTSRDADDRRRSLIALGRFGPEGLDQLGPQTASTQARLVQLRADPSAQVRHVAGGIGDLLVPDWTKSPAGAQAVPFLVDQLVAEDINVRTAAAAVLAQLDPKVLRPVPGLLPRLIKLCTDDSGMVRDTVLTALNRLDPRWRDTPQARDLFEQLVKQLDSRTGDDRKAAAETLGRLAPLPEAALCALVALAGKSRDDAAGTAAAVISRHGAQLPEAVAREVRRTVRELAGKPSTPELRILRQLGPAAADAVPLLIGCLGERPSLADAVVETLEALDKSWRESAKLEEMLRQWAERAADKDQVKHRQGVVALAAVGPLGERDQLARGAIASLIPDLTPPPMEPGGDQDYDRHSAEAIAAARALGNIGPRASEAVQPLLERLNMPLTRAELTAEEQAELEAVWEALGRVDKLWALSAAAERASILWQRWGRDRSSEVARLRARLCQQWLQRYKEARRRSEKS
jgi:HEAT repeat protein